VELLEPEAVLQVPGKAGKRRGKEVWVLQEVPGGDGSGSGAGVKGDGG